MAGKGKAQGRERGAEALPGQACGRDDAAGASTAMRRRARHQCPQIGRLEEAESDPAITVRQTMSTMPGPAAASPQRHADAEQHQAEAAEDADG